MAKEKSKNPILDEAKERYKVSVDGWKDIFDAAREDLKFTYDVDDGQWDSKVRAQRAGRPCITVNKLQKFVRQQRGDFMLNRPRMKVIPADDKADVRTAELYNGILRQIEYLSNASIAYDTAYGHAVASSIGFYRILTKYSDEKTFDQDIFISRIVNPLSVHFDPFAVEFNLEDARYCFVEELILKKDFEKLYPSVEMTEFNGEKNNLLNYWADEEHIKICEYYYKEPVKKKIVLVDSGDVFELSKDLTIDLLKSKGLKIVNDRTVDSHIVKWCKMTGSDILEDTVWAGSGIPIIPMFGDEVVVDGKRYYLSLIRGAKGSQEMYNYWASAATENVMLTPKTPFLVDHRQIKGFEQEWEEANVNPKMFLRYNAVAGITKPQREPQTQVPAAIIEMMQSTAYDIEDHLGRYEASKGEASNERSGKAILARISQSDKGAFTYVDNASRSIIAGLKQIVELIPKIYDTKRALNILGENGEHGRVEVNAPDGGLDEQGNPTLDNDLTAGKYDVIATIGASFSSKREEMVKMLIESMQYAPMLAPIIAPLVFQYSDWPGAEDVANAIKQGMAQAQQAEVNQQVGSQGVENAAYQQVKQI